MKTAGIDEIMQQVRVVRSAWALIGGKFDFGNALENAEYEYGILRYMIQGALRDAAQGEKP